METLEQGVKMLKVNNKDTRTMAMMFLVSLFQTYLTACFSASIPEFEHVLVCWDNSNIIRFHTRSSMKLLSSIILKLHVYFLAFPETTTKSVLPHNAGARLFTKNF